MVELISDETEVSIVEEKIFVKRTIKEEYSANEYLNTISKLEYGMEQGQKQIDDSKQMKDKLDPFADAVKKIDAFQKEEIRKQREIDIKKSLEGDVKAVDKLVEEVDELVEKKD